MAKISEVKQIFFSRSQAARLIGVGVTTVRRLEQSGRLKAVRLTSSPTGRVYFKRADVLALVEDDIDAEGLAECAPVGTDKPDRMLLSKNEVCERVGRSFSALWAMMKRNEFPMARVCGDKSCWLAAEVDAWVAALPKREYAQNNDTSAVQRAKRRGGRDA